MLSSDYDKEVIAEYNRRATRTSPEQFQVMTDFIAKHPNMASGKLTRSFTAEDKEKLWADLTAILNKEIPGPKKPVKKWRRTWTDLKCEVKDKVSERFHLQKLGVVELPQLSQLYKKVAAISGFITARTPPVFEKEKESQVHVVRIKCEFHERPDLVEPEYTTPVTEEIDSGVANMPVVEDSHTGVANMPVISSVTTMSPAAPIIENVKNEEDMYYMPIIISSVPEDDTFETISAATVEQRPVASPSNSPQVLSEDVDITQSPVQESSNLRIEEVDQEGIEQDSENEHVFQMPIDSVPPIHEQSKPKKRRRHQELDDKPLKDLVSTEEKKTEALTSIACILSARNEISREILNVEGERNKLLQERNSIENARNAIFKSLLEHLSGKIS